MLWPDALGLTPLTTMGVDNWAAYVRIVINTAGGRTENSEAMLSSYMISQTG